MSALSGASVPKLPRGVRLHFDRVRDAYVLLAPERAFNVDATAVRVLKLVDGTRTLADIAATLAAEFNAALELVEHDVAAMLTDLINKRVVEA